MINLSGVSKIYPPQVDALNDVSLHIDPGEFVSIVGQSGSGKTTIVRLLIAEIAPDNGQIEIGGWNISSIKKHQVPFFLSYFLYHFHEVFSSFYQQQN